MSFDFKLPVITASTEAGKLQQLQSYMHQLVEQLNWAMNSIDSISAQPVKTSVTVAPSAQQEEATNNFNSIKGLIIKSADIVQAYYEEINDLLKLSGEYVAEATFPDGSATFVKKTNLAVKANSNSIEQFYTDMQKVISDLDGLNGSLHEVTGTIKTGLLYVDDNGIPVYGLEVGQRSSINGKEVFNRYARFVANRLSFYDRNGNEVAYISDYKLYITNVEITGKFKHSGFEDTVMVDKSVVTKWVGGS